MKLGTKINLLTFAVLLTLTFSIVLVGTFVINDIVYSLNHKLMEQELKSVKQEITRRYSVLIRSGLSNAPNYVQTTKQAILDKLSEFSFGKTGNLFIFTTEGKSVWHSKRAIQPELPTIPYRKMIQRRHGSIEYIFRGEKRFCLFTYFSDWNWIIGLSVTTEEMFQKKREYLQKISGIAAILFLLNLTLTSLLWYRLSKRITQTLYCTAQVESGNLEARIAPIKSKDEIGLLQTGINSMIENIQLRTQQQLEAQNEIKQNEQRLSAILHAVQAGILIIDCKTFTITDANPAAAKILSYRLDELKGKKCSDTICSHDTANCPMQILKQKKLTTKSIMKGKNKEIPVIQNIVSVNIKGQECFVESFISIAELKKAEEALRKAHTELEERVKERTHELLIANKKLETEIEERKRIEKAIRKSETRFKDIAAAMGDWIWEMNTRGEFTYCSEKTVDLLGFKPEEMAGKMFTEFLAPFDIERVYEIFQDASEKKESIFSLRTTMLKKDGSKTVQLSAAIPIINSKGELNGFRGVNKDISAQIKTENENTKLMAQLYQAHKLESIGTLSAGIAHEINTPTQFIGDNTRFVAGSFNDLLKLIERYSQLLKKYTDTQKASELEKEVNSVNEKYDLQYLKTEVPDALKQTIEGIEQVSGIVSAMKDFSHIGSEKKKPTDLNKAINSTIIVCRNEWKYVADVQTNLAPNLPLVNCYSADINQVIMNLIVNATHAIADAIKDHPEQKGKIVITTKATDQNAIISISDTGTGIPEEIQQKIFDPFFTTKQIGKGTGQGLSIAYSTIVEKHKGNLYFETKQNVGTTFFVELPLEKA